MPVRGDLVTYCRQHYFGPSGQGDEFWIWTRPYAEMGVDVTVKTLLTPMQFAEHLDEMFGRDRPVFTEDGYPADDLATVVADIRSHRISYGGAHAVTTD